MNKQNQEDASIPLCDPSPGAQPDTGLDLQKLAELINLGCPGLHAKADEDDLRITQDKNLEDADPFFDDIRWVPSCDDEANSHFIVWGLLRVRDLVGRPISLWNCSGPQWRVGYAISGDILGKGETIELAVYHALVLALSTAEKKEEPNQPPPTEKP